MPADNIDPMSKNEVEEGGLAGDDFIGAVKATRDPWWKRKRIVCPLILSFVAAGIVATAVGVTLSSQRDGGDGAANSSPTTTDSVQSSGSPSPAPTPAPSIRGSGSELSGAIDHMWKTLAPTDGFVRGTRRPTSSPSPTERSLAPTTAPPSPSPTSSSPPTEDCHRVEIYIVYDSFPTETSWDITNDLGEVMISYEEEDVLAMTHERTVCLPEASYRFAIRDVHGDGMLSPGYYSLTSKGEYIDSGCGIDIGHGTTSEFSLPWTPVPDGEITYLGTVESEELKQEKESFLDIMEDVFELEEWDV